MLNKLNTLHFNLKKIFENVTISSTNIQNVMVYKFVCEGNFNIDNLNISVPFNFIIEQKNLDNDIFLMNYFINTNESINNNVIKFPTTLENINNDINHIITNKKMDAGFINECIKKTMIAEESLPNDTPMETTEDKVLDILSEKAKIKNIEKVTNYMHDFNKYTAYICNEKLEYAHMINTEIVLRNAEVDYIITTENNKTIILV